MLYYAFANKKCYLKAISLSISIPIAGWQETFRSPASRLAGDFCASGAGWQETKKSPASRLAGDLAIIKTFQMVTEIQVRNELKILIRGHN